jgi:hypothetical protein
MVITTTDYADFLIFTANLTERKSVVFYRTPAIGFQVAMVVSSSLAISCALPTNEPTSFPSDFPGAILVSTPIGFV